jgi:SAM-dependent methyltransferase
MAVPSSCPLCAASAERLAPVAPRVYGDDTGRGVFHCASCDVRFLFPRLSTEEESRLYTAEFERFMVARSAANAGWEGPEKHIAANEGERTRRMAHLAPFLGRKLRILEVGCSSGFMLYPLIETGHDCVAIEPSGVFSDYVRNRGVKCFSTLDEMLAAGEGSDKFDLIVHYYVLEHVSDPTSFLKGQIDLLKPEGRIVFEVPNANDALTTIYDIPAYERFIWVVSHTWYFSEASLADAIRRAGGKPNVRLDQRYDLSNHIVWARDGRPGGAGRFTGIWGAGIEGAYKKALIEARRCDTLVGIVTA